MSDRIEQVLGFDIGGALSGLTTLDEKLSSINTKIDKLTGTLVSFNQTADVSQTRFRSLASGANSFAKALERLNAISASKNQIGFAPDKVLQPKIDPSVIENASKSIQANLTTIQNATSNAANSTQQNVTRMTVSFGLLARIVFTQFVIKSLRELTAALNDAAGAAIELDRQVQRTAVIDDLGRSVGTLRDQVIQLSNEFNKPVAEVATAQYELLQRGIKSVADQQKIFDQSLKLSKVINIEAADSLKLITGVLDAYHLSADNAGEVSAFLFQTIKDGNVTAAELAEKLGPVTALAAEMGVNFKEVGAALVVMTKQGTGTATALTQLRGLLTGFLKPSQDLQRVFQDSASGLDSTSISVLGLGETLRRLRDAAKGNPEQLALLLRNVRALSGATQLTSDDLDAYIEALTNQKAAQQDLMDQKFAEVMSNAAEQVSAAVNAIKNVFTQEFGQQIIQIGDNFIQAAGGAQQLAESIRVIATGAGVLAKALASPFIGAERVGQFFGRLRNDLTGATATEEQFRQVVVQAIEDIKQEETALAEQLRADQEKIDQYNKSFIQGTAQARNAYTQNVQGIITANKGLVSGVKNQLQQIKAAFQAISDAAGNVQSRITEIQNETHNAIQGLDADLDKLKIERFIQNATDPAEQFGIVIQHSNQLLAEGTQQLAAAGLDAQKRADAIAKLNLSREYAQQAAQIAKGTSNLELQNQAQVALKKNAEGYRDALTEAEQKIVKSQPELEKLASQLVSIGPEAEEFIKKIADNVGILQNKQFLSKDQIKQAEDVIAQAAQGLTKLGAQISPQLLKSLGFDDKKIAQVLSQVKVQAKDVPLNAIAETDRLKAQLDTFFDAYKASIKVDISGLEKVTKSKIETPTDVQRGVKEASDQLRQVNEQLDRAASKRNELAAIVTNFAIPLKDALQQIPDKALDFAGFGGLDLGPLRADAEAVSQIFDKLSKPQNVNADSLKKADEATAQLLSDIDRLKQANPGASTKIDNLFAPFLRNLDLLKQGILKDGNPLDKLLDPAKLQQLQQQQQQLQQLLTLSPQVGQPLSQGGEALSDGSNSLSSIGLPASTSIATNISSAAESLNFAVQALQLAAATPITIQTQTFSMGGDLTAFFGRPNFFAAGGHSRGQDKIHALIDPHESVINARSTQKFFSQIQTLNSGRVPVFHGASESSGPGDINIQNLTVPGGPTNETSARALVHEIQRQRRLGRVKRFR